ncbi:hypothetical protein [Simiduia agarivorans]|uniref:Uncharacterized protein n=1 Tax=Simiduia agarivorans (strain DSM 21679 / JCM 13881 / BCRC 17597 / SA1) TaxID=1117647 RepID=K4KGE9_SIMAS|nr:hypothetical protein [Simiduia agarivorans]AFU97260.2 hypothetical protein M5M_00105 [Simiduia agarivorans SA1 = DSM 21679]
MDWNFFWIKTMPIVNCVISPDCQPSNENLVELWAREAGIDPEHITVNLITRNQQWGKTYKVMANLWLPSVWSDTQVSAIQLGLARALARFYHLHPDDIHVITSVVESGRVVESGCEVN